ncbi:MAG: BlaI/MecI/CopY family transcriptional regulator [Cyanobacteriota bacterium]|nr:BlaI/MecI/CopY family transcriptional regulator [Cyanobacteriota bacterium]
MSDSPPYRPKQLSLGSLEAEIVQILWGFGSASAKEIHEAILRDPDRELAYPSVMTVLQRLTHKGWVRCDKSERSFRWYPLLSQQEAKAIAAHDHLQHLLSVDHPDIVAAFAERLDAQSVEQLETLAAQVRAARRAKQQEHQP